MSDEMFSARWRRKILSQGDLVERSLWRKLTHQFEISKGFRDPGKSPSLQWDPLAREPKYINRRPVVQPFRDWFKPRYEDRRPTGGLRRYGL